MAKQAEAPHIPVIDCSGLLSGLSWPTPRVVEQITQACREWGFFQIVNSGVPEDIVQDHFQQVAR